MRVALARLAGSTLVVARFTPVFARSTLFALIQIILTPIFAVIALLTFPFDALTRYRIISLWARLVLAAAESICGVRYRVEGLEHLPVAPTIIASKHQSAWETIAFQMIFPPQVWVLKKRLLLIPFFGWGLAMMNPIAIDRRSGARALRQTREQGEQRLRDGFWIVIFPEGTRVAPGRKAKYQLGAAWLAVETGASILPVAVNSGELWGKGAFLKYPGEITVRIGASISPDGLRPDALNRKIEGWIESEMQVISGTARGG